MSLQGRKTLVQISYYFSSGLAQGKASEALFQELLYRRAQKISRDHWIVCCVAVTTRDANPRIVEQGAEGQVG